MSEQEQQVPLADAGPWRWAKIGSDWMLVTQHSGQQFVLGVRGGPGRGATKLAVRDQARCLIIPFDPAHPNAVLIEMAPELLAVARDALAALRALQGPDVSGALRSELERVIGLATRH